MIRLVYMGLYFQCTYWISKKQLFVAFPWVVTSTGRGGFMVVCVFYDGNSRRLNQKCFYGEAWNLTCDPWFTRHRFVPYRLRKTSIQFNFVAVFLGCTSTGRVDLCFLWFYVQELLKAQLVVVLVLKRLRRRGNGLKSHPTDWEKPGIEPATPGLQEIGLSPTPRRLLNLHSV